MPVLNNNRLTNYASYSPGLTSVRVVTVSKHPAARHIVPLMAVGVIFGALLSSGRFAVAHYQASTTPPQTVVSQPVAKPVVKPAPQLPAPAPQPAVEPPTTVNTVATQPVNSSDLQSILDKWQKNYTWAKTGIVVQELGGSNRSASLNPNKQYPAASLFKVFLANYVYDQIDQGKLSFSQTLHGMPANIATCIQRMIVISDNACGDSVGDAVGWTNLHNFVRAEGYNDTIMSPDNITTAGDMAKFLANLQNGTAMAADHKNQLIGYMKVQKYRDGIPAGVPGQSVADKIGSNPGIYHDAAIVYGPKSTYVLVIMSQNGSPAAFKDLSARLSKYFNQ